jgi:hypothetical protein
MSDVYRAVCEDVARYCTGKGYREGVGINNFVPHDAVAAFGMARQLVCEIMFDHYLAVAPEGHIYGYFFERLGCKTTEVYVPYPPVAIRILEDLSVIKNKRILIIEDDIISGRSLQLVVGELLRNKPSEINLFLGHSKGIQHLDNIPLKISRTFIAEDIYACCDPISLEKEFLRYFLNKP